MNNVAVKGNAELHYGSDRVDRLYARAWGESIHFGYYPDEETDLEAAVFETKRRMAAIGKIGPKTRVLEVASGWGATARYLVRACGAQVTATNVEDDHLRTAENMTLELGLEHMIHHAAADFHFLRFDDARFDAWWCQEATVHAEDKPQVFREAFRVLRPGGRIIFSDQTTVRDLCSLSDLERISSRHGSADLYNHTDFLGALECVGFENVRNFDWSEHMGRHFANLVSRIEQTYDTLIADIPEETVLFNLSLWRLGRDLTAKGAIGWHCFVGEKA